ncbi:MAG: NnrS family protein [Rhodobacteraceae bacterium]|nr:NnrS family protein [Paracoccaceae bacterium]
MTVLARFFGDGFRVFFFAAGLFAMLAMMVWAGWLGVHAYGGMVDLPTSAAPHLWHAHEMIFGYGAAAMAGFFLTAVPNWTGARAAPQIFNAAVAGLWLMGRVAVWQSAQLPAGLVALIDLAFVPVLAAKLLGQLLKRPKPQQMILLAMLGLFWSGNLMTHLEWIGLTADTLWAGLRVGLFSLGALIMVLGGRVTPGFTRNAMVQSGRETGLPRNPMPLAATAIAAAVAVPLGLMTRAPDLAQGLAALIAGGAGLLRVALWRGGWTTGKPILWTLHLSYALNAVGFMAFGLANLGLGSEVAALHLLGIGGVGGMTLAVMSRATLGHSGRALLAPGPVVLAYVMVPLAALARFAGSAWPGLYYPAIFTAAALWSMAFALFTIALSPAFFGPRQNRPTPKVAK